MKNLFGAAIVAVFAVLGAERAHAAVLNATDVFEATITIPFDVYVFGYSFQIWAAGIIHAGDGYSWSIGTTYGGAELGALNGHVVFSDAAGPTFTGAIDFVPGVTAAGTVLYFSWTQESGSLDMLYDFLTVREGTDGEFFEIRSVDAVPLPASLPVLAGG